MNARLTSMLPPRCWPLLGAVLGLALGFSDHVLFALMGIEMSAAGRNVTLAVTGFFSATFAGLGWTIGRLLQAESKARRDARIIRDQLSALEASRRAVLHNEKLAAIGRLAAGLAHEMRNPLGVIRSSASVLRDSFDDGTQGSRASDFIVEEIDRLNALITSLLDFARPAALTIERVSIADVVDRAVVLAADVLGRRQVSVTVDRGAALPEIQADPDLLAQVLLGLLANAAEAVQPGGRVEVRVRASGSMLSIDVADDGPGVAPADVDRLFEPFFTTKASGTGLGLAMGARIAAAHGGTVDLVAGAGAGAGGRGACFSLRLPTAVLTREPVSA